MIAPAMKSAKLIVVAAGMILGSAAGQQALAQATCPEHSVEVSAAVSTTQVGTNRTVTTEHFCQPVAASPDTGMKCKDTFVAYGGKCQLQAAVEDQLQQKILAALKGIQSTADAIAADHSAVILGAVGDNIKSLGVSAGQAVIKRDPLLIAPAALSLAYDLGSAAAQWDPATANASLKAEYANLQTFQTILRDAGTQLYNLQHP